MCDPVFQCFTIYGIFCLVCILHTIIHSHSHHHTLTLTAAGKHCRSSTDNHSSTSFRAGQHHCVPNRWLVCVKCMHVCVCVCMPACMCVCVCMPACMRVCVCWQIDEMIIIFCVNSYSHAWYKWLIHTVMLTLSYTHTTHSSPGILRAGTDDVCVNVTYPDTVNYRVSVSATPEACGILGNQSISAQIQFIGFGTVDVSISLMCDCDCDNPVCSIFRTLLLCL